MGEDFEEFNFESRPEDVTSSSVEEKRTARLPETSGDVGIPIESREKKEKHADDDLDSPTRHNAEFIDRQDIEFHQETVEVGKKKFFISVFKKEGRNKQKYLVLHDSENIAFDTGLRAIANGGELIALESKDKRKMFAFGEGEGSTDQDPNRMFSPDNRYWPVADKILELGGRSSGEMLVALHNNRPDGDFHLDNIEKWDNATVLSRQDPDSRSMIWIPGLSPKPSQELAAEIQYYQDLHLNVVYEHVPQDKPDDGSLSAYMAKNGLPYINIEVVNGIEGDRKSELASQEKQARYVEAVRSYHPRQQASH